MAPLEKTAEYFNGLVESMKSDEDYSWSWHANLAMAFKDHGVPHNMANIGASEFMKRCFDVDTSRWPQKFGAEESVE